GVDQSCQRVEVWLVRYIEPVFVDRGGERDRVEQRAAEAAKERQSIRRAIDVPYVGADPISVLFEASAFRRIRRISPDALGQLLAQKWIEMITAVLVGLQVQIEADDGKRPRTEVGETVELA